MRRDYHLIVPITITTLALTLSACSSNGAKVGDIVDPPVEQVESEGSIVLGESSFPEGIVTAPNGVKYVGGFGDGIVYKANQFSKSSEIGSVRFSVSILLFCRKRIESCQRTSISTKL